MTLLTTEFWLARIANLQGMLVAYDAAILALALGAQNYQLDTGQTRQMVTRANLATLRVTRAELLNELVTLEARLCGSGVVRVNPGW